MQLVLLNLMNKISDQTDRRGIILIRKHDLKLIIQELVFCLWGFLLTISSLF